MWQDIPPEMEVVICHQSIVPQDAVGNDISGMYQLLATRFRTAVYGDFVRLPGVEHLDAPALSTLLAGEGNLVVYHHSIYWPAGEEILRRARARVVVRYHNI